VQAKGTKDLDASALLMPIVRFITPVDRMWLSTLRAIEKHLIEDTLVRRYDVERGHVDGLPGTDGSFTACSFWYIECLARAGELQNGLSHHVPVDCYRELRIRAIKTLGTININEVNVLGI
jgi:GH15 family glucan-1,4-alpha-glucosidase